MDHSHVADVVFGKDFNQRRLGRLDVEVEHADGVAAGRIASAADRHLGDVDLMGAENGADGSNDAGYVAMAEDEQDAVQIRL